MHTRFSLRQWLIVPYVALILGVAALIGSLSYRAGSEMVDTLASNLMLETVARIEQAVDRHLFGSAAVLEAAFPRGVAARADLAQDLDTLRTRFWAATALHPDSNNNVIYGNRAGQLAAMYRTGPQSVEWRVRPSATGPRLTYPLPAIDAPLPVPTVVGPPLDPRTRPWYTQASTSKTFIWTSVYIDALTRDLVVTRAKRVMDRQGGLQGVTATDVPLQTLNEFVRSLPLTPHGVAFVMESSGDLIASSRTPNIQRDAQGDNIRVNALHSSDALQATAYRHVREAMQGSTGPQTHGSVHFTGPDGAAAQLAFSRLHDESGLDWLVVVAVPRNDFMQGVTANVVRTAAIAAAAALAAALIGLLILNWLSKDLQHLTTAAQRVGAGQLDDVIEVRGRGSIGELARTFREMQLRLRTDALTGLSNRDWLMRNINARLERGRRQADGQGFAVLFIDMNKFKTINDTLGHEAGDAVLIEVASRLREATRSSDTVARYAGDEFVVLLDPVADLASAELIRHKVEAALRAPLALDHHKAPGGVNFGAAVGLAVHPGPANDAEDLVRMADQDMYRRKSRPTV